MNARLDRIRILIRKLELIGRVDFRIELMMLNAAALRRQALEAIAAHAAAPNLQAATPRIRNTVAADDLVLHPNLDRPAQCRLSPDVENRGRWS